MTPFIKLNQPILLFLALSLLLHGVGFLGTQLFINVFPSAIKPTKKVFKITSFKTQKFRTVGIKGGKKNIFTLPPGAPPTIAQKPIPPKQTKAKKTQKSLKKKIVKPKKALSLDALRVNKTISAQPEKMDKKTRTMLKRPESRIIRFKPSKHAVTAKQKHLLRADIDPSTIKALKKSEFDIQFEIPEGISENELNKIEQIFYSFQKRVFENYVSAFTRSLQDFKRKYPNFSLDRKSEVVSLTGKVTFDVKGNIRKIKIVQSSRYDELDQLFFKTMQEIHKLPNPPKDFVKNGKPFSIYYRLIIK